MGQATHKDILSVFPGIQDHAAVEIMAMRATVDDLEAAFAVMTSDDEHLIDVKQREGGQIHHLLVILGRAGVHPATDR